MDIFWIELTFVNLHPPICINNDGGVAPRAYRSFNAVAWLFYYSQSRVRAARYPMEYNIGLPQLVCLCKRIMRKSHTQVHTIYDTHPLINSRYRVGRILNVILIFYFSYILYANPKHFFYPKLFFQIQEWRTGTTAPFLDFIFFYIFFLFYN